ncbi:MAG: SHOCT domain-containing protein, partial [Rhizobiaceae bacterium]|nr:SHOCT domain-containing protein [Rhizobiaceae bacterium]
APQSVVVKSEEGKPVDQGSTQQHYKDGYPSFNGPLTAANVQINDQQASDIGKQLTALGNQRASGAISEAEYQKRVADMRKLAAEHGQDTLTQIHQQSQAPADPTPAQTQN